MTPTAVAIAVSNAEDFAALARSFDRTYPTYIDGGGVEHYVPGPGSRQVREAIEQLKWALQELRYSTSTALPMLDGSALNEAEKGGAATR